VKLAGDVPERSRQVQKRVKFITHRMETAIAAPEFEKARFYSDAEIATGATTSCHTRVRRRIEESYGNPERTSCA